MSLSVLNNSVITAAPEYNETEIRFHIIDPIIRQLGYPNEDKVYIKLEEKLEYPYVHIGRRSKKDLPLGFPDYRAGLKGTRGSFIVEAKAGSVPITTKEIEQAHSYAAHAQVGANYFVLCNGSSIFVFETLSGSDAKPLVNIPLTSVNERFHELEGVLAPTSLAKNCQVKHDLNMKLVNGVGSSVQVRSGRYLMSDYQFRILMNGQDSTDLIRRSAPQLTEAKQQLELLKTAFELQVSDGQVGRDSDGRIVASVKFLGATKHNDQAMKIMGIDEIEFSTADEFISDDINNPSMFESTKDFDVSKGSVIPQFFGGATTIETDMAGGLFVKAAIHYKNGMMLGEYVAMSVQAFDLPGPTNVEVELDFSGTFELVLDN